MALLNRHRRFVGWMKGDERQTSLFVCLTVGLTWVDLIRPCTRRAEPKTRERQREKKSGWTWREKGGGGSWMNPLCFSFLSHFKKNTFFWSLAFSLSNCCHVFNIICNLFQTPTDAAAAAIFTLQPNTKTGKDSTRGKWHRKPQKKLTQQKTKSNSSVFASVLP